METPPRWLDAIAYASREHRHHLRRDAKTPYVSHVFRVMMVTRDVFGCENEIALLSAVLHDTIEDTPTDYDDIERRFGEETARCVATLTKNMLLREEDRERDYDQRLAGGPWQARLVKLADVYDNLVDCVSSGLSNKRRDRAIARAHRAIELANADSQSHECVARAIEHVRAIIASHTPTPS